MNMLRWLRVIGDTLFGFGAFAFVAFVVRLTLTASVTSAHLGAA